MEALDLAFGVASRALPGQASCGDVHVIESLPQGALIAVLDGLGHGSDAAHAAQASLKHIPNDLAEKILGCSLFDCFSLDDPTPLQLSIKGST